MDRYQQKIFNINYLVMRSTYPKKLKENIKCTKANFQFTNDFSMFSFTYKNFYYTQTCIKFYKIHLTQVLLLDKFV